MMPPSQPQSTRPAIDRSMSLILLAFVITSTFCLPLTANDMLQQGHWKGKYTPVNFGADIGATFCIQPDDSSKQSWQVMMTLDLPPPGNEPVKFEFQEVEEDPLKFRIELLGVPRECLFKNKDEDELIFECAFIDIESDSNESLTMRRVVPPPEDVCQPEETVERE